MYMYMSSGTTILEYVSICDRKALWCYITLCLRHRVTNYFSAYLSSWCKYCGIVALKAICNKLYTTVASEAN